MLATTDNTTSWKLKATWHNANCLYKHKIYVVTDRQQWLVYGFMLAVILKFTSLDIPFKAKIFMLWLNYKHLTKEKCGDVLLDVLLEWAESKDLF